jgi:ADP-ribose pyrophosphatase
LADRIVERVTLLQASRFRVDRVSYLLPDGQLARREVIEHPGAVVIIPVLEDGRICLIRNYRVAVQQEMIELPAGTLEPGEPPLETARRELLEETGFRGGQFRDLMQLLMSPGILHERMHVFLAWQLTLGPPERESGEEIDNLLLTPQEIRQLILKNEITDSKTVSALLYYFHFLADIDGLPGS